MRLRWTIKVYEKAGNQFRVKVEGTPYGYSEPWVDGYGDAASIGDAFSKAISRLPTRELAFFSERKA